MVNRISLSAVVVVAACWAASARAELLTNGSFENSTGVTWTAPNVYATVSGSQITGWNVDGGNFGWYLGPGWGTPAYSGSYMLNPQPGFGSLAQSFGVTAGWDYTVSFWARARDAEGPGRQGSVVAEISGVPRTGTSSVVSDFNSMTWTQYSFTFTPTVSGSSTLSLFGGTGGPNGGGYGAYIDNVSVVGVPEPSAIALAAAGLVGLFCYSRRRRG